MANFRKHRLDKFEHKRLIINTSWLVGERVYQMAISFVVGILTARYLGPANYGLINYASAFVLFALPICSLGLEGILIKQFVNDPNDAGRDIGTSIIMRFTISIISTMVIVLLVKVLNPRDQVVLLVAFLQALSLLFRSFEVIEFWYQAKLQSKYTSLAKTAGYTVMSLFRVMLLVKEASVEWFAMAISVDVFVIAALYLLIYRRGGGPKLEFNFARGKNLLSQSRHFILSGFFAVVYMQMDNILIQQFKTTEDVGLYSAAYTIATIWFFIPLAIMNSARPLIMKAKTQNESQYMRRLKQLYAVVFWLGIAVAMVMTFFADFLISTLYGTAFRGATTTLKIMVWFGAFAQLVSARNIWIISEQKQRFISRFALMGVIVNLSMNLILIPKMGIEGSAITTLTTHLVVSLLAPLLYRDTRQHTRYALEAIFFKW